MHPTLRIDRRHALLLLLAAAWRPANARKTGPLRDGPVERIVIHSTGGPTCDAHGRAVWVPAGDLETDRREIEAHPALGIHYLIGRDGRVVASVPEDRVAHHVLHYSRQSIGIELVNDGDGVDPFPEPQLAALVELLRELATRHGLKASAIQRHSDLDHRRMPCAPERRRKVDPGAAFPFDSVLRRAFGPPALP